MAGVAPTISDLKITGVEAIYLRLPEVKTQCDSGQDALIVKVTTDAGIIGYGEVDSNPMAVKGCIEGPFSHTTATGLAHRADRRRPVPRPSTSGTRCTGPISTAAGAGSPSTR